MPDLVLHLRIDVDSLVPRVLRGRSMDYWESGMDMHLGSDPYESFRKYQRKLIREYNRMSREFGFVNLDATLPIDAIQEKVRAKVKALLEERKIRALTESLETIRPLLFEPEPEKPRGGLETAGVRGITPSPSPGA